MVALYIVGGLLGLIALLLMIPLRFRVTYRERLTVTMRVLFLLPFTLFEESDSDKEEPQADKPKSSAKSKKQEKPEKKPGWLKQRAAAVRSEGTTAWMDWLKETAGLVAGATKRLLRAIVIRRLYVRAYIVGEDAAQTALTCGRISAAAYPLLGAICCAVQTRRQDVRVEPDFLGEQSRVVLDARLSVSPWRLLWAGIWAFAGYLQSTKGTENRRYEKKVQRIAEKKIEKLNKEKQTQTHEKEAS